MKCTSADRITAWPVWKLGEQLGRGYLRPPQLSQASNAEALGTGAASRGYASSRYGASQLRECERVKMRVRLE